MAREQSARCYTTSHTTTKYEASEWKGIVSTSRSDGKEVGLEAPYLHSGPDSNGNYKIGFRNTTPGVTFSCTTQYGTASKTFRDRVADLPTITAASISFTGASVSVNITHNINTGTFTLSIPVNCRVYINSPNNCQYGILVSTISPSTWTSSSTNGTTSVSVTVWYKAPPSGVGNLECTKGTIDIEVIPTANNTVFKKGVSAVTSRVVGIYS